VPSAGAFRTSIMNRFAGAQRCGVSIVELHAWEGAQ
jgi:hypothetical protein